ncbi:hypothetical protein LLG46_02240 [bacterium]|nr:hypothetical protein [bacterium]
MFFRLQRHATDETKAVHKAAVSIVNNLGSRGQFEDEYISIKVYPRTASDPENVAIRLQDNGDDGKGTLVFYGTAWSGMVGSFRPGMWVKHVVMLGSEAGTKAVAYRQLQEAKEAQFFEPVDDGFVFDHKEVA